VYRLQQTAHLKHDSDLIREGIRGSAERLPGSLPHLAEGTGPAKREGMSVLNVLEELRQHVNAEDLYNKGKTAKL
jgi:hypothetical protein